MILMPTKAEVEEAAYNFLKAVAKTLEAQLGKYPKCSQHSTWMVHTTPGSMSSREFTREVFNRMAASMVYQTEFAHSTIKQQQELQETKSIS